MNQHNKMKDNYKELKEKYEKKFVSDLTHIELCWKSVASVSEVWNFILKEVIPMVEKKTRDKILDEVKHCLGLWVSSEYQAEHYEDEAISPKDFWQEWTKLEKELRNEI